MKNLVISFVLFVSISCSNNEKEIIALNFQKDLIPEGIAIDSASQTVFLSSLRYNKIVKSKIDGRAAEDLITSNQYNFLPGFGMTVKGDTLFALGNTLPKRNGRSILLLLNKNTGAFIRSYAPDDSTFKYLNDLAVSHKDDVYITDSESNKLYIVPRSTGVMQVFVKSDDIANANGIAISPDDKYIYLASDKQGIRIIEIATKKIVNEQPNGYTGIDGMKYYQHSLIAIVNGKRDERENGVYRFFLNEENMSITEKKKLISPGDDFVLPTTFAILDGYMYFVIDSQITNLDSERNQILDSTKLKNYKLLKFKI
jgi:WD40 repeat protein